MLDVGDCILSDGVVNYLVEQETGATLEYRCRNTTCRNLSVGKCKHIFFSRLLSSLASTFLMPKGAGNTASQRKCVLQQDGDFVCYQGE